MKYIRKPIIVEAEQFLIDTPHPLLGSPSVINLPSSVKTHKGCGYRMCEICGGGPPTETIYYLQDLFNVKYLQNGDWIVTHGKNIHIVMSDKDFKETYDIFKE